MDHWNGYFRTNCRCRLLPARSKYEKPELWFGTANWHGGFCYAPTPAWDKPMRYRIPAVAGTPRYENETWSLELFGCGWCHPSPLDSGPVSGYGACFRSPE